MKATCKNCSGLLERASDSGAWNHIVGFCRHPEPLDDSEVVRLRVANASLLAACKAWLAWDGENGMDELDRQTKEAIAKAEGVK